MLNIKMSGATEDDEEDESIHIKNGRADRAVKHWVIAANMGHDQSMEMLKECVNLRLTLSLRSNRSI